MGNMEMLVMNIHNYIHITGWWFQPVEKYESQFGLFFSIYIYIYRKKQKTPTSHFSLQTHVLWNFNIPRPRASPDMTAYHHCSFLRWFLKVYAPCSDTLNKSKNHHLVLKYPIVSSLCHHVILHLSSFIHIFT